MSAAVLHIVLSLSPGGTERLVIELSRRTSALVRGVVALDEPGLWASELAPLGIPVTALHRQPGFHPALGPQIARLARSCGASVLHCHHYSPFVYGRLALLFETGLRLVFTEHGRLSDAAPSRKRRLVNPFLARFKGSIHAVSNDLRTFMISEGFPASRVSVIHNGVDPGPLVTPRDSAEAKARLGLEADALVLGTVGRLDLVKDISTLIHAFALLSPGRPALRLVIVGDGDQRAMLEHLTQQLGVDGLVRFTGQRQDARQLMHAFDVYASSSISEGISLTLLEAMAASRPIVATRVGGNPEVVHDAVTGLLVPPRSPEALAVSVDALLSAPARRAAMGDAGRERLESRFSLDRMVADYVHAYASQERG